MPYPSSYSFILWFVISLLHEIRTNISYNNYFSDSSMSLMSLSFPQLNFIFPFVCCNVHHHIFRHPPGFILHFAGVGMHVINYHILPCWILTTVLRCFSHCFFTQIDTSDSVPYEMNVRASICAGIHADLRVLAHCVCVSVCVLYAYLKSCMYIYCMYAMYDFNLNLFHTSNNTLNRCASPYCRLFCFTLSYVINQ